MRCQFRFPLFVIIIALFLLGPALSLWAQQQLPANQPAGEFVQQETVEPPVVGPQNQPPGQQLPVPSIRLPQLSEGSGTVFPQPTLPPVVQTTPVVPVAPTGTPCPADPPAPIVTLRVRVAACAAAGQPITYKICVENLSPAPAHHVLVRNPLPKNATFVRADPQPTIQDSELLWALGTLPGGACRKICLVLQPTNQHDVKNCARVQFEHGQCTITRIAGAPPQVFPGPGPVIPLPGTQPPLKEQKPPIKQQPPPKGKVPPIPPKKETSQLKLEVKGPVRAYVSSSATYTITVSNVGKVPAQRVLIETDVPKDKMEFVAASQGGVFLLNQVAWYVGTLSPGEKKEVTATLKSKAVGEVCIEPLVRADDTRAQTKFCTEFLGIPALGFKVSVTRDPVVVGEKTKYVMEVVNQGSAPVTNIQIRAFLPAGKMEFIKANGPTKDNLKGNINTGEEVVFAPLPTLAAGATARYEVEVQALEAQKDAVLFSSELTADQLHAGGPVINKQPTRIVPDNGP